MVETYVGSSQDIVFSPDLIHDVEDVLRWLTPERVLDWLDRHGPLWSEPADMFICNLCCVDDDTWPCLNFVLAYVLYNQRHTK